MNRFALITGGSKGLGAHLVRRFWHEGYSLTIVARNTESLRSVAQQLPKRRGQTVALRICDLADTTAIEDLIDTINEVNPQLDVLVNNAAMQGPIGALCKNNLSEWNRTIQVNLLAPVALCHGLIPMMTRKDGASIINLSGGGATTARANFSAYATAKAGLVRFSETIAEELKPSGVRVNCIAPGAMQTEMLHEVLMNRNAAGTREASIASEVFDKGGSSMDKVADLALFLASDKSKGITGKIISAVWDNWELWPKHLGELSQSDVYTLRRIAGRDRGLGWGDK